jgi:predicted nucleotide-binding protein
MTKAEQKDRYSKLVERGENIVRRSRAFRVRSVKSWQNASVRWLRENLPESGLAEDIILVSPPTGSPSSGGRMSSSDIRNVQRVLKVLYRARDLLPFLDDGKKQQAPHPENVRKVFIVHGHNDALKVSVARLLDKINLEPIILHEQPNLGRTIIEKFLDHSDVAFAVVLLTGDDRGGPAHEPPEKYKLRARQNVILELGYFIRALGRKRVAAIYQQDVEIPSDYSGVLFIPHDESGVWQFRLAKEIRASGIRVDLNKL